MIIERIVHIIAKFIAVGAVAILLMVPSSSIEKEIGLILFTSQL